MDKGDPGRLHESFSHQQSVGAAVILAFLTDLFTASRKEQFNKVEILVIIDGIGTGELPPGLYDAVKAIGTELEEQL